MKLEGSVCPHNKGSYRRDCLTVLNAGVVVEDGVGVRVVWHMQFDKHVVAWTCDFFACNVSGGVFVWDMRTHHTLTNGMYNRCFTLLHVYSTLCHMTCMWPHLHCRSSSHQLLKLVSQNAPHYRSWQWRKAFPLSLLPSWKHWLWSGPWRK